MKKKCFWGIGILVVIVIISAIYFLHTSSEDETVSLYSKSCDELEGLRSAEFDKLDFSCRTDLDCSLTSPLPCGGCINKNTETKSYKLIDNVLYDKGCITTVISCLVAIGCKCLNNTCEAIIPK